MKSIFLILLSISISISSCYEVVASDTNRGKQFHKANKYSARQLKSQSKSKNIQARLATEQYASMEEFRHVPQFRMNTRTAILLTYLAVSGQIISLANAERPGNTSSSVAAGSHHFHNTTVETEEIIVVPQQQQCQPYTEISSIAPLSAERNNDVLAIAKSNLPSKPFKTYNDVCGKKLRPAETDSIVSDFYNRTVPKILSFIQRARAMGQSVGILLGETHSTCSCFAVELEMLKVMLHQGIRTLFHENTQQALDLMQDLIIQGPLKGKAVTDSKREFELIKGHYLFTSGLTIRPSEDYYPRYLKTGDFLEQMQKLWNKEFYIKVNKVILGLKGSDLSPNKTKDQQLVKAFTDQLEPWEITLLGDHLIKVQSTLAKDIARMKEHLRAGGSDSETRRLLAKTRSEFNELRDELKDCIDFTERDKQAVRNLEGLDGDYAYLLGSSHIGTLKRLLKPTSKRVYLALTCSEIVNRAVNDMERGMIKRYTSKRCLEEYEAKVNDQVYANSSRNPCVIGTIDDDSLAKK